MIKPIIATTIRIPTHTPALKIPPITSHEDRKEIIQRRLPYNTTFLFISSFSRWYAKTLPQGKAGNPSTLRPCSVLPKNPRWSRLPLFSKSYNDALA